MVICGSGGRRSRATPAASCIASRARAMASRNSASPTPRRAERAEGRLGLPRPTTAPKPIGCEGASGASRCRSAHASRARASSMSPRKASVRCKSSRCTRRTPGGGAPMRSCSWGARTLRAMNQFGLIDPRYTDSARRPVRTTWVASTAGSARTSKPLELGSGFEGLEPDSNVGVTRARPGRQRHGSPAPNAEGARTRFERQKRGLRGGESPSAASPEVGLAVPS
jgi:hypothetical protein